VLQYGLSKNPLFFIILTVVHTLVLQSQRVAQYSFTHRRRDQKLGSALTFYDEHGAGRHSAASGSQSDPNALFDLSE
jgi:hypothetical protein